MDKAIKDLRLTAMNKPLITGPRGKGKDVLFEITTGVKWLGDGSYVEGRSTVGNLLSTQQIRGDQLRNSAKTFSVDCPVRKTGK